MSNLPYSRTVFNGKTFLSPTDYQVYIDTKDGIATVVLPKIETVFNYYANSLGNPNAIFGFRFKDLGFAGVNKIVFEGMDNDKINGVQKYDVTKSGASGILMISGINSYTLVSDISGSTPVPPFNNPFDFYLDAAAPDGGDGSIEAPFNTITALNNAVIALSNPNQSYTANIAPSDTSYGSEVIGSLNIAPNLSLIGQTPQNTTISCNINLVSPAIGVVNQYRNIALNGLFTLDLSLSTFASISFQNGAFNVNRTDSNTSAFVVLQGALGASSIGGIVLIQGVFQLDDITVNDGATLLCSNLFVLNGKLKLNGNSVLKTLSTLNPTPDYVDGTPNISGTPIWITDYSSNQTYSGTLNKTVLGEGWQTNGNLNGALKSIGTLDNFDFPIVVNGAEVGRFTTDKRLFLGDTKANNGSDEGLQYSSLIANRAQIRNNQYGANSAGAGLTTFKSRGDVIGAPITPAIPANNVQVGDIIQGFTGIGLTDNGAGTGLIPLAYTQRVIVVQNANGSVACDWEVSLCPLNGTTNSIRKAFGFTSEGIQKCLEGNNGMAGVATLDVTGTAVISNTNVKASTKFMLTVQDGGSIPTGTIYQSSRVNGTSFTIKSNAGAADSGVQVYYQLYEPIV